MRKLLSLSMLLFLILVWGRSVHATEYLAYQDITFENPNTVFLDDYSNTMYKNHYKKVNKRKFWGWRTHTVYRKEELAYVRETLYRIHNEGDTPITETFRFESGETIKRQFDASGSIAMSGSGPVKTFKLGLESEIEGSISVTTTTKLEEEVSIKVMVDPDTTLLVQIKGEAKVSNGVGAYYMFWRRVRRGGWEVFTITTEYYSIVKERIVE